MRAVVAAVAMFAAAACQSASDSSVSQAIAARQGAPVEEVCFSERIGRSEILGSREVVVGKAPGAWFKLDLSGACRPQRALEMIDDRTSVAGSFCISPGDQLKTFESQYGGGCWIDAIYEWDPDIRVSPAG